MSAEEDTELRDLVAQSLESKGVLGKIRAQLRASVFMALDEQDESENKIPVSNPNLKKFLNTTEGRLVTGLVREFLEFFDLDFTIAVFDPETNYSDQYQGRNNLANELNLQDVDKKPLLLEVIQRMAQEGHAPTTKHPVATKDTQPLVKTTAKQNGPLSPHSSSPPSVGKEDDDDDDHSELMISAGFESDEDMKPSKIPQRVRDDKSPRHSHASENGLDSFGDGKLDVTDKTLNGRGNPDKTIGSDDDDDIFAEFLSSKSSLQTNKSRKEGRKPLDGQLEPGAKSLGGILGGLSPGLSAGAGLGSLKDAPPLPGIKQTTTDFSKSPDWNDLADIDNRINKLGFDIPGDDKSNIHSQDYDYEDDFQASSSHLSDHSLSFTEEIEEQLSSYHSNSSKVDDPLTTDHTVSRASDSGLDYAEDILDDF